MDRIWIDGGKLPIDRAGYATKREPGGSLLGPTLETLTGESRLDPGPVDTDLNGHSDSMGGVVLTDDEVIGTTRAFASSDSVATTRS